MTIDQSDIERIVDKAMLVPTYGSNLKSITAGCDANDQVRSDLIAWATRSGVKGDVDEFKASTRISLNDTGDGPRVPSTFDLCTDGIADVVVNAIMSEITKHPGYDGSREGAARKA